MTCDPHPNRHLDERLFLRLRLIQRACSAGAARARSIAQSMPPTFAWSFASAHPASRTVGLRSTIRTDAAVLFETGRLPCGAFLLCFPRAAIAAAVAALAGANLCGQREGGATHHQSRHNQSRECFAFHTFINCRFDLTIGRVSAPFSTEQTTGR